MTTFRPDTSFPFLAFARKYCLDYGEVLRASDIIQAKGHRGPGISEGVSLVFSALHLVCLTEAIRRKEVAR